MMMAAWTSALSMNLRQASGITVFNSFPTVLTGCFSTSPNGEGAKGS
jgi:hypothetical protein